MVSDFKMKRLKTWKLFNESVDYDLSIIKDMLLDFTDKDIYVDVSEGVWSHVDNAQIDYVKVDIGRPYGHNAFTIESSIFDVIDYLSNCGLQLMEDSWFWYNGWQYYVGCPNCSSEDIVDNYESGVFTYCNGCGYIGDPDRFLLDRWPLTQRRLELAISERKRINQIELLFSQRKSLYGNSLNESFTQNESFSQVEIDEIKSTVSDMLLELQFDNIRAGVWVLSDKMVQVELRKSVKDKSSAVLWGDTDENRAFEWSDVSGVIDSVSGYLGEWGFVPYWDEPNFEVRAYWGGDENTHLAGYDTCLYLKWKGGGSVVG